MIYNINKKNLNWYKYDIKKQDREILHKHHGLVLWLTGLSGSGKSTIANFLEKKLYKFGISTYLLDGDNVRYGLCNDLNFTKKHRKENIRRISEVVYLMLDAGLVIITAFISPYKKDRKKIRDKIGKNFIEIFVDTPLFICKKRDPKGLYKKVKSKEIINFTGIDLKYEIPDNPEIYLNGQEPLEKSIKKIINYLKNIINLKNNNKKILK